MVNIAEYKVGNIGQAMHQLGVGITIPGGYIYLGMPLTELMSYITSYNRSIGLSESTYTFNQCNREITLRCGSIQSNIEITGRFISKIEFNGNVEHFISQISQKISITKSRGIYYLDVNINGLTCSIKDGKNNNFILDISKAKVLEPAFVGTIKPLTRDEAVKYQNQSTSYKADIINSSKEEKVTKSLRSLETQIVCLREDIRNKTKEANEIQSRIRALNDAVDNNKLITDKLRATLMEYENKGYISPTDNNCLLLHQNKNNTHEEVKDVTLYVVTHQTDSCIWLEDCATENQEYAEKVARQVERETHSHAFITTRTESKRETVVDTDYFKCKEIFDTFSDKMSILLRQKKALEQEHMKLKRILQDIASSESSMRETYKEIEKLKN